MKRSYEKGCTASVIVLFFAALIAASPVFAAQNEATNAGSVGVSLVNSTPVVVNAVATLQLVKQVYSMTGTCLASAPADGNCSSSATSVTVPSGTQLKFVIFVRNTTDVALADVRIQDNLDDTAGATGGFTYVATTLKVDNSQTDLATIADIYSNVDTSGAAQSDNIDGDVASAQNTNANPGEDRITIGAVAVQTNNTVSVPAHTTYAVLFQATKN